MAHGENHAKRVVLKQADVIEEKLSNGSKADPEVQGDGILLLLQMVRPLFEARFVTEEDCKRNMEACKTACADADEEKGMAKLTIGHWSIAGTSGVIVTGIICFTLLHLFDKWPW